VFTRSGEVTVAIRMVCDVVLTSAELSRIYSFHHFIFNHVLRLEKLPMTFDPEHAETSNIVVPVNKGDVALFVVLTGVLLLLCLCLSYRWCQPARGIVFGCVHCMHKYTYVCLGRGVFQFACHLVCPVMFTWCSHAC